MDIDKIVTALSPELWVVLGIILIILSFIPVIVAVFGVLAIGLGIVLYMRKNKKSNGFGGNQAWF